MATQTAQEVINALGAISKARFMAMDENGDWGIYSVKPHTEEKMWWVEDGFHNAIELSGFLYDIQPAENWKESLVEYQPKK